MKRYEDPNDPLNGPKYQTGKKCIEKGCDNPAGTHWSPFWCQACNAKRMARIGNSLAAMVIQASGEVRAPSVGMPPDGFASLTESE